MRSTCSANSLLTSAGVVGLVDSLHVARGVTWPADEETGVPCEPTNPDAGTASFKLGACYTALGHSMLMNAHDAGADVEANVCLLASPPFLANMRAEPCMYELGQCVLRARTFRQRHANLPSAAKERAEVELLVQRFADAAPAASRLSLPPVSKALRGAAHGEAKRLHHLDARRRRERGHALCRSCAGAHEAGLDPIMGIGKT
jgi:hypothetical protein